MQIFIGGIFLDIYNIKKINMPIIALRGITVFPDTTVNLI